MKSSAASDEVHARTPIQDLPPLCLGLVFSALEKSNDRNACSEVCKAWKNVDDQTRESYTLSLSRFHKPAPSPAILSGVLSRFQNLRSLTVLYMELSPDYLSVLTSGGQRISQLVMRMCKGTGLDSTALHLSKLTELRLTRLPDLSDAGLVNLVAASRRLKTLYVDGCSLLTDKGFAALAAPCPDILTLHLVRIYGVLGQGIADGCPHLTSLNSSSGKIDGSGLKAICARCPSLTDLSLSSSNLHWAEDYEAISLCRRLQKLELPEPRAFRDTALGAILAGCPDLRTLELPRWDSQNLSTAVFPVHKNLTRLDLSYSAGLTAQQLEHIVARSFPALRVLVIIDIEAVDWEFETIKAQLQGLNPQLEVRGTSKVGAESPMSYALGPCLP